MTAALPLALALLALPAGAGAATPFVQAFELEKPAEVQAAVSARCAECDWGKAGREAAVLALTLDGRPSQELMLVRGAEAAEYTVTLGPLARGRHTLSLRFDRGLSAKAVRGAEVDAVRIVTIGEDDPRYLVTAYAPLIYPRADALPRFSDVPLILWSEAEALPHGRRFRYSIIFTNEDGGTPADRLMATWGRLTDIEYVYGVDVDEAGRVVRDEVQGPSHKMMPFHGRRLGRHPILYDVTDNNMVADHGPGTRLQAPAPVPFDLTGVSREAVMDANPWTYRVSSLEGFREGRVREGAVPGSGALPDPRTFAYLEACVEGTEAALTFAVGTRAPDGAVAWHASNGDQPRFRIIRTPDNFPNGCFRGAVALPAGTRDEDIVALRFKAETRPVHEGEPPIPPGQGSARLLSVNRLFRLGAGYALGRNLFAWKGDLPMAMDGAAVELPIGAAR